MGRLHELLNEEEEEGPDDGDEVGEKGEGHDAHLGTREELLVEDVRGRTRNDHCQHKQVGDRVVRILSKLYVIIIKGLKEDAEDEVGEADCHGDVSSLGRFLNLEDVAQQCDGDRDDGL